MRRIERFPGAFFLSQHSTLLQWSPSVPAASASPPSDNLLHWAKLHCNHSKLEYIIACRLNLCRRECTAPKLILRALQHIPSQRQTDRKRISALPLLHLFWFIKAYICPGSHAGGLSKLMTPLIFPAHLTGFSWGSYMVSRAITEPLNW